MSEENTEAVETAPVTEGQEQAEVVDGQPAPVAHPVQIALDAVNDKLVDLINIARADGYDHGVAFQKNQQATQPAPVEGEKPEVVIDPALPGSEQTVSEEYMLKTEHETLLAEALKAQKADIQAKLQAVDKNEDDAIAAIFADEPTPAEQTVSAQP